jgi:hypothetical protein
MSNGIASETSVTQAQGTVPRSYASATADMSLLGLTIGEASEERQAGGA